MVDSIGAKRRWVVDIFTRVYIIVNQKICSIIISLAFPGGAGGRRHG